MLLLQILECMKGEALSAQLLFDARDLHAREPAHPERTHGDAIVVRSERLRERVLERRYDEELLDVLRREHQRGRQKVRRVRRVEASAEDGDAPPAEFHPCAPLENLEF